MAFWKCDQWLVTSCLGTPNLVIMWLDVKRAIVFPSFKYVGMALAHFEKVINHHDDIPMALSWRWMTCRKIDSPLREGTDGNGKVHWSRMRANLSGKNLAWVAFFDRFYTIFEKGWPKVPYSQNFLGGCQPRQMTTTCSTMAIIQNLLYLLLT